MHWEYNNIFSAGFLWLSTDNWIVKDDEMKMAEMHGAMLQTPFHAPLPPPPPPPNTSLVRASDAVGESLRVSAVLSCGICCSQALWGARSLQYYGMQSQKSPQALLIWWWWGVRGWPKIVVKRTPSGPLTVAVQCWAAGELGGALVHTSSELVPEFCRFDVWH